MSETPQKYLKHHISSYYSLTDWLLGATIGNQGHLVMDLQRVNASLYQQRIKHLKICLKHQIPYYYPLNDWLLGATVGNHGHSVIYLQWS